LLMKEIEQLNNYSLSNMQYQKVSEHLEEAVSSENVLKSLELKYEDINNQFRMEWNEAILNISEKMKLEESEFENHHKELFAKLNLKTLTYLPNGENAIADGAFKGAAIGGAYGVAAATYSAVLGPYAAAVTMGTAFAAIIPGVLLMGAVTGIAVKLVLGNKKKAEYIMEITRVFQEVRNNVNSTIIPKLNDRIELESNQIANTLYEQLCDFMSDGWSEEELLAVREQLHEYMHLITGWESQVREMETVY
ncbi:hypothetical protein, partial [Paenisporosarcina sp.]|uniref:hypothetical protein n=1 Tax=Paenisporosarcina sp. TaxID=1932001 RepID=UPI003C77516C